MSAFLNRNGVVVKIPKEKPRADRIHALLHQYFSASLSLDTLVELSQQLHTAGDVSNCGGDTSALLLFQNNGTCTNPACPRQAPLFANKRGVSCFFDSVATCLFQAHPPLVLSDDVDASYREAALGNGKELDVFMQLCRKLGGVQQHDAVEAWECLADALQFEHIQLVEHTWVDGVQSNANMETHVLYVDQLKTESVRELDGKQQTVVTEQVIKNTPHIVAVVVNCRVFEVCDTVSFSEQQNQDYTLRGIVAHIPSSSNTGHYVSIVRCADGLVLFDDLRVESESVLKEKNTLRAVLCFYEHTSQHMSL